MGINLLNKTVLVTGSTDGLGRLLALNLAQSGANVIVHGRDIDKANKTLQELDEMKKSGSHGFVICDLNEPEKVTGAFSRIEKLDILINNAGVWEEGTTTEVLPERIMELVNVNLASYLLLTRLLLPRLEESEYGQVLNVISVAGYEVPSDYFHTYYSATKYGLQGFTEGLEKEYSGKNIRIMGYYPGGMDTGFFKKAGQEYKESEPWMFDPIESVEAILFMLTRNKKVTIKRLDLITHLFD